MIDRIAVSDIALTREGYLRVKATLARTGQQDYYGREIGEKPADKLFKIQRPEAEVFSDAALASFRLVPVTDAHPDQGVSAANWRKEAIGVVADDTRREGDHMVSTLVISDASVIDRIKKAGHVELSCGYSCDLDMTPGVAADGAPYDGIQRNILGNHVAVVEQGRCGPSCKVGADHMPQMKDCAGDSECECTRKAKKDTEMTTKTVTHDGKQLEVAADVAAVIEALQAKVKDHDALKTEAGKLADIVEAHTAVKDKELSDAKKEIESLKAKVLDDAAVQKLADARASLIADAKLIDAKIECAGKDDKAIRKDVVKLALGDKFVDGKSDEYYAFAFDMLLDRAKNADDPIVAAFKGGVHKASDAAVKASNDYESRMASAWQN